MGEMANEKEEKEGKPKQECLYDREEGRQQGVVTIKDRRGKRERSGNSGIVIRREK